jgi:apolipoprotein N-acyltransferase
MPKELKYIFISVLSGILLALSFPNSHLYLLAWIALIPLLYVTSQKTVLGAFWHGFVTGFIAYAVMMYWIYVTVKFNTNSWQQSFLCLFFLSCYLALYIGVWSLLINAVNRSLSVLRFSVFAASTWVMLEYVRTYLLTGFPWNLLGYSQYKLLPVIQISEFTGVYGVSFLIVFVNVGLWQFIKTRRPLPFVTLAASLTLITVFGWQRLNSVYYSSPPYVTVAVMQPNIDQYKKFDSAYEAEIFNTLGELAKKAAEHKPDVIVWPETAIPGYLPSNAYMYAWVSTLARETNTYHLVGTPYYNGGADYYNATVVFSSNGELVGWHKKVHLVPFGEFIPFRKYLSKYFEILNTLGDFTRSRDITPLPVKSMFCGTTICSENFFGYISRTFTKKGAQFLTNQTNDAWFFKTSAPMQHFIMNVFRAIENRRSIVVCGNTGVSGAVEPSGYISMTVPIFTKTYFLTRVAPRDTLTFYTRFGDLFAMGCIAAFFLMIFSSFSVRINRFVKSRKLKALIGGEDDK